MMKKLFTLFSVFSLVWMGEEAICQVGIGTIHPDASAVLDVSSTDKGLLIPRMTSTQRNAIVEPANGLTIFNLDEDCLQINLGSIISPDWSCIGSSASVTNDCSTNGFEGNYILGIGLTAANKFSVTITNNSFSSASLNFTTGDLVLSGISGLSVSSVSPTSATINPGSAQVVEYSITGTPGNIGKLTGIWTKSGLNCTKLVNVLNGSAIFTTLPLTETIVSLNDGTPVVDIQGVIDNGSNQLTLELPYTSGQGTYTAYNGTFILNNSGTGEGGDENSFRLTYPSGTFSSSGTITATVEVDGDGSFDVSKLLFGGEATIATLDFRVNGVSNGSVILKVIGGVADRNFASSEHKFIYFPVVAADGNTWLNNNLGANYANMNDVNFSPTQQATNENDHHAYGSLYQWGRYSDGHELMNYTGPSTGTSVYGNTSIISGSETPGHNLFITSSNNWLSPQNDNLWQGESGINNPCPEGYRLPTETEFDAMIIAEGISDRPSALSSTLALPIGGLNSRTTGNFTHTTNVSGFYWTSSVSGGFARQRQIRITGSIGNSSFRAEGMSVRCIRN